MLIVLKFGKFYILYSIFTTSSTARYNYSRNFWRLTVTVVFPISMNWRAWVFRRVERDKRGYIIISKSGSSCYKDEFSITSFVSPYGTRTHFFMVGIKLGERIPNIVCYLQFIQSLFRNQFVDTIVLNALTFRLYRIRTRPSDSKPVVLPITPSNHMAVYAGIEPASQP